MTSGKFATTLGYERRFNPAFLLKNRDRFIAFMTDGQPSRPANIQNIIAINQGRKPLSMDLPQPRPLSPEETLQRSEQDHIIVDTRSSDAFGTGHIPGAINIQRESDEFEQRVGWVLEGDAPLIMVLREGDDAAEVARALAFIGLEQRMAGFLAGGMAAWEKAGLPTTTLTQIHAADLNRALAAGNLLLLDVREADEWEEGHVHGARNLSYKSLPAQLPELDLRPDQAIAVTCAGGFRSSTAASYLQRHGYTNMINLVGGMDAWKEAGLHMVDGAGNAC